MFITEYEGSVTQEYNGSLEKIYPCQHKEIIFTKKREKYNKGDRKESYIFSKCKLCGKNFVGIEVSVFNRFPVKHYIPLELTY